MGIFHKIYCEFRFPCLRFSENYAPLSPTIDRQINNIVSVPTPDVKEQPGPMNMKSDRMTTMLDLLDVFYKNHELFYKTSFQVFLLQINNSLSVKQSTVQGVKRISF